jgi:antitoxin (DNA-binding transcriptional repressor) of toxin-antitoxin stability system
MRLTVREAAEQFSKAIRAVKAGEDVVITERGRPIAVIRRLPPVRHRELEPLVISGLLRPATKSGPMPPFRPVKIKGEPLSETIRKERQARW